MAGLRGGHQRCAQHGVKAMNAKEFCTGVLAHIPRATAAEREAIRQELEEHLSDHQEVLVEHGLSPEEAEEQSIAAMGEAAAIGQQWNDQLSPLWLWVGRLCKTAVILLVLGMLMPLGITIYGLSQNFSARWSSEPMDGWKEPEAVWSENVDLREPFADQMIRFFQVSLVKEAWTDRDGHTGDFQVELDVLAYAKNPLKPALNMNILSEITCNGTTGIGGGFGSQGVSAWSIQYPVQPGTPEATFTLSYHGEAASVTVPLNWEEVDYGA